jgi:hypothetical protein
MRPLFALSIAVTTAAAISACGIFGDDDKSPETNAANVTAAGGGACGNALAPGAVPEEVPDDLACTGLYTNIEWKVLAPTARAYTPAVQFWSDGYEKDRFISLPDGQAIDASNVDDWKFPVGTKAWKEIHKGPRKIETRFFWKVKEDTWLQATYVWSEDQKSAKKKDGDIFVDGKPYHVPKTSDCNDCHRGRKDKILGFEAISLAQPGALGITLQTLVDEKRINPPPVKTSVTLPDPALGVLHANCGITCHNNTPTATALSTGLRLRMSFADVASGKPAPEWEAFTSTIGIGAKMPGWDGAIRVKPGVPEESLIIEVMKLRGEGQMPPIATTEVDQQGVGAIENWIRAMPKAAAQ